MFSTKKCGDYGFNVIHVNARILIQSIISFRELQLRYGIRKRQCSDLENQITLVEINSINDRYKTNTTHMSQTMCIDVVNTCDNCLSLQYMYTIPIGST
jgi:hypothetical protein